MNIGIDKTAKRQRPVLRLVLGSVVLLVLMIISAGVALFAYYLGILPALLIVNIIGFFGLFAFLIVGFWIVLKSGGVAEVLWKNISRLDELRAGQMKSIAALNKIDQNTRLSETTKKIAFRDVEKRSLRDAVMYRLQPQDFDGAYEIIDEIAHSTIFKQFAEQLRQEVGRYKAATDKEREGQIISHIDKLLDNCEWGRASAQIERLIAANPASDGARQMRQRFVDKKQERKKVLLNAWDNAVSREATDRSLEILQELDQYLTPNEGLALQEAARDVFRNKLHNLGVRFSMAVSGSQWERALKIGSQIVNDFPNSKMAEEIREKWDVLEKKAGKQTSATKKS